MPGPHQQFEMNRRIVKSLVERVEIEKDRTLRVVFHLDVATLLERAGMTAQIDSAEIYTRAFDLIRHRHKVLVEL